MPVRGGGDSACRGWQRSSCADICWDDRDWIRVELEAGETYAIELHGSAKLNGWSEERQDASGPPATLRDWHMRGAFYVADGNRIGDDALGWGGLDARWHRPPGRKEGWLNRVEFTPTESGTYYVNVDTGHSPGLENGHKAPDEAVGTYMVSVAESDFVATEEHTLQAPRRRGLSTATRGAGQRAMRSAIAMQP